MLYIVYGLLILWIGFVIYKFRQGKIEDGLDFVFFAFIIPMLFCCLVVIFGFAMYGLYSLPKRTKCKTTDIFQFTQKIEYDDYEERRTGGKIKHTVLVPSQYISVLLANNKELQINKKDAIIYYNQDKQEIHYRDYCFGKNYIVYLKANEIND